MKSEYLLELNSTVLMDCCAARKAELEKAYDVVVRCSAENIKEATRHCGMPCLKEKK